MALEFLRKGKRMAERDHTLEVKKFDGDVTNHQSVTLKGEEIVLLSPSTVMTREQALVHAAWLVALADESANYAEFRAALKAVLGT